MVVKVSIPEDDDGFVLLRCRFCGEYFKIRASDFKNESNIGIWCPYCGLDGRSYITEEVLDRANKIAFNISNKEIYNTLKDFEKKAKNSFIKISVGRMPKEKKISPIQNKIDRLETKEYRCCHANVKIDPISAMCGSYCPICGGIDYE